MSEPRLTYRYLLLFPAKTTNLGGNRVVSTTPKDAPYFYDLDISFELLGTKTLPFQDGTVSISYQLLDGEILLADCAYPLPSSLTLSLEQDKQTLQALLKQTIKQQWGYTGSVTEEYSIICISGSQMKPDAYIAKHAAHLAGLMRSSGNLSSEQIEQTLKSRMRFSSADLTVIDWEGALVIDDDGDVESEIELFKIGNFQLIKYRLLNATLESQLTSLSNIVHDKHKSLLPRGNNILEKVVDSQLKVNLEFEHIDQALLLIGDWYSAQLYRTIVDEFYVDEWKAIVKEKLEQVSSIDEVIQQHLTFSWSRFLDFVQIAGWMIILAGYFFLLLQDLRK